MVKEGFFFLFRRLKDKFRKPIFKKILRAQDLLKYISRSFLNKITKLEFYRQQSFKRSKDWCKFQVGF